MSQPVNKRTVWIVGTILFVAMAFTVPVLYYMFVVGGILSYATLFVFCGVGLMDYFVGARIVNLIHIVVYGGLLLFISAFVAKRLSRRPAKEVLVQLSVILVLLFGISLLPIYGFFGHGTYAPKNAYQALFELCAELLSQLR